MRHKIKQRGLMLFEESIRSKYTKQNYQSNLNQFIKFARINSSIKLLTISQMKLQHILEDYLVDLKHNTNPNSIPSKFQGIKHFCIMNEINLNWNKIYKMFPAKQKTQNLKSYTSNEIRNMISAEKNIKNKTLIHFLASTGARVGVFDHNLSIKHLKKMSCNSYAVLLYAGDMMEYWSFLTPQASKILDKYHNLRKQKGEIFCGDTPIFGIDKTIQRQISWNGVRSIIYRSILKSKIVRHKQNNRYDIQADHGFRKRFNTILKLDNSVNYNIAEKLMGHKNGLDGVYFTPTLDELFAEFKKVIRRLEI